MSGLIAVVGKNSGSLNQRALENTINRVGSMHCASLQSGDCLLSVSRHSIAPGYSKRIYEDDRYVAGYSGDVVNWKDLRWRDICEFLSDGNSDGLASAQLRGSFVLAVYDKADGQLYAVTDPFAWLPCYFQQTDDGVAVSTSLGTFLQLRPADSAINRSWLYQFLFFNFALGSTTPIGGVSRLPPCTITRFCASTGTISQTEYRDRPERSSKLLENEAAASRAIDVFNEVVPKYFLDEGATIIGLSAGLDSRTLLAALPVTALDSLHSFTYGIPGSSEITECSQIADNLGLQHQSVPLGDEFRNALPQLARDTVYLSDGLQNVNRSHLLYIYRCLHNDDSPFSKLVTGISGDHIFRDHIRGKGNIPHMMTEELSRQHALGRCPIDYSQYADILRSPASELADCVEPALDEIESTFGPLGEPQTYLSFLMYVVGPRYFSGEAAIANSVTTFRNPYWDPDIVRLGYELRYATLGSSESVTSRDTFREAQAQASVIAANPRCSEVSYGGLPINVYATGNKAAYQIYRAARKVRSVMQRRQFIYGEDWSQWYRSAMSEEIQELLGDESRVREFVTAEFIDKAVSETNVHWLGKLLTAEYTLRLVENGWQRAVN